jgi:hypothetical protein
MGALDAVKDLVRGTKEERAVIEQALILAGSDGRLDIKGLEIIKDGEKTRRALNFRRIITGLAVFGVLVGVWKSCDDYSQRVDGAPSAQITKQGAVSVGESVE